LNVKVTYALVCFFITPKKYLSDTVKIRGFRYFMKEEATNTNSKEIFYFDE